MGVGGVERKAGTCPAWKEKARGSKDCGGSRSVPVAVEVSRTEKEGEGKEKGGKEGGKEGGGDREN